MMTKWAKWAARVGARRQLPAGAVMVAVGLLAAGSAEAQSPDSLVWPTPEAAGVALWPAVEASPMAQGPSSVQASPATSLRAAAATSLQAPSQWEPPRLFVGGSFVVAQPRGEFAEYVDVGFGVQGFVLGTLDPGGILGVRADVSVLTYGRETKRVCLGGGVGCRIDVDLTTSNNIILGSLGPEVSLPAGPLRVYGHLGVGFSWFATDSQVSGSLQDQQPFASSRNQSDGGFAWNGGGGVRLQVSGGRTPVALDFGVTHQTNGRREYLTEGGIVDLPDGSIQLNTIRSDADFLVWRLGASVGLRPSGDMR